jgi:multisubunit Na+/H+ antiporter MnhB subunit
LYNLDKNKMISSRKFVAITLLAILGLAVIPFAHAANPNPPSPVQSQSDLQKVLCNIVAYFFWIVIIISVIMILYAAFSYVTARDDTERTSRARRTLTYAAIGIAVALLAYGFPSIIAGFFPGANLTFQCSAG